jgi:hypothetical protein
MQLDAVEPGFARSRRGFGEECRQRLRERGDVRLRGVGDALAGAPSQRLELAGASTCSSSLSPSSASRARTDSSAAPSMSSARRCAAVSLR